MIAMIYHDAKETVLVENDYAYCAVDITDEAVAKVERDEIYLIDGRWYDCCSMPLRDWIADYWHDEFTACPLADFELEPSVAEALRRTQA